MDGLNDLMKGLSYYCDVGCNVFHVVVVSHTWDNVNGA